MKKFNSSGFAVKLVVFAILCAAFVGIGLVTGVFESFAGTFKGINLNVNSIIKVLVMAALVLAVENLILLIMSVLKTENRRTQSVISIVGNALRYITAVVILGWGLTILGADVGTVVAGIGILALIIGFGANSLIADLVTGVFMIFENQYNIGDYIEVGGFRGKVTSIGIRTTCIEDPGGNVKIINNSDMSNILNRSDHSSKAVSTIGIPYETDLEALEEKIPGMLKEIYDRHSDVMLSEPKYLGVDELADSAVVLKFIAEVDDKNIYSAGRVLNRELFLCFRKVGVNVPFPQVDVHQK
ncbi:MAG: mechanosensitive ion channel family protein [Oscillospiraceae bacterium]|nr:mechanosensitive ion channel family protein [Oscillospiraceae bacterium]MBR2807083.1 mechanosensitive ion channel family protein [Oscillospiraceae bacterium]